jgi:hypothetical protein
VWDCGGGATSGEISGRLRVRWWDNGLDSSEDTGDESNEVVGRAWTGVHEQAGLKCVGCDLWWVRTSCGVTVWDCDGGATSGGIGERVRARGWDNGLDS